jgi:hypothetical protein
MNTDVISDEESDDFTDEEEQQTMTRHPSICENQLYNSTKPESSNSQWYIDLSKPDSFESSNGNKSK